jgi:hypothetical protein
LFTENVQRKNNILILEGGESETDISIVAEGFIRNVMKIQTMTCATWIMGPEWEDEGAS